MPRSPGRHHRELTLGAKAIVRHEIGETVIDFGVFLEGVAAQVNLGSGAAEKTNCQHRMCRSSEIATCESVRGIDRRILKF